MKHCVSARVCLSSIVALWLSTVTCVPSAAAARHSYAGRADDASRLLHEPEVISSDVFNTPVLEDASSILEDKDLDDASLGGINFAAVVKEELLKRKGKDLPDACTNCVMPMAVKACKMAWKKLQNWCKAHTDDKAKEACKEYKAHPKTFLLKRVLRATVNPIDAAYSVCWWRGKCG